jgi:hypothetical protein
MADKRDEVFGTYHVEPGPEGGDPFAPLEARERPEAPPEHLHIRHGFKCMTDKRGYQQPGGRDIDPARLWVNASQGFVPLWGPDVILRWRFATGTLDHFRNPAAAAATIERLLAAAVQAWGDAAPIRFAKCEDAADFEIIVSHVNDCEDGACVLASAFFPDGGHHKLRIYPAMFDQSLKEQVETLIHEVGHIFGLRHFFAAISETAWAAEVFGTDSQFTIMNYGENSFLTETDKADLKRLYQMVWSGRLTQVNGTPIRLMRPFHEARSQERAVAIAAVGG